MSFLLRIISVSTYARIKPGEIEKDQVGNSLTLGEAIYKFDKVLPGPTPQTKIFTSIGLPLVGRFLEGKNISLITLGGRGCG